MAQPVQLGTVKVTGLRDVLSGLNKIERGAHKTVMGGLMDAAEPVRQSWVSRISKYPAASTSTITPKLVTKGVFITQRARKVTGKRGDFGSLQMRHGLAALYDEADNTRKEVERALDMLTRSAGF